MYKSFSKVVKEFENQKFNDWVQGASLFVDNMMKKNILRVQFTAEARKFFKSDNVFNNESRLQ